MSDFKVSRVAAQTVVPVVSKGLVYEVNGNYMKRRTVNAQIYEVAGNYMRDARILDMTKPLKVSAVRAQVIVPVVVDTTITEIGVLMLKSQNDRVIPETTGAFLQTRQA